MLQLTSLIQKYSAGNKDVEGVCIKMKDIQNTVWSEDEGYYSIECS